MQLTEPLIFGCAAPQQEEEELISHQDQTPHKFSSPHVIGRFSAGGLLCRVLPNSPKEGAAACIEFHDLNVLLGDLPSAQELKDYPGKEKNRTRNQKS